MLRVSARICQRGQAIRRTFVGLSFCLFLPCFLMKICQTKWAAKVCQTSPFYLGSATAGYLELCCCCCSDSTCWSNLGKLRALSLALSLSVHACLTIFKVGRRMAGWLAHCSHCFRLILNKWIRYDVCGRFKAWKVKEITHDLNHDLTFYCTHNQLCVPQYKVNV